MRLHTFVLCCLTAGCAHLRAPNDEMVSDRPDFTESTSIVPVGRVQLEAGVTRTTTDSDLVRHWSVGEALLRTGINRRVEARVTLPTWNLRRRTGLSYPSDPSGGFEVLRQTDVLPPHREAGYDDVTVGLKAKLLEPSEGAPGIVPTIAGIVATALPTAHGPFALDGWQPEAKLAFDWEVNERVGFGANANATWPEGSDAEYDASWTVGIAVAERVGLYGEWFGFGFSRWKTASEYVNAGLTYRITPYFQLDGRIGRQLNARDPESFLGAGFVVRF